MVIKLIVAVSGLAFGFEGFLELLRDFIAGTGELRANTLARDVFRRLDRRVVVADKDDVGSLAIGH